MPSKSVSCPICQKVLKNNRNLKIHTRHVHDKLKPEKCPNCEKSFTCKASGDIFYFLYQCAISNPKKVRLFFFNFPDTINEFFVGVRSWLADKLSFHPLSYEAGFYKPTVLKVHPPFCRITAYATMPG